MREHVKITINYNARVQAPGGGGRGWDEAEDSALLNNHGVIRVQDEKHGVIHLQGEINMMCFMYKVKKKPM